MAKKKKIGSSGLILGDENNRVVKHDIFDDMAYEGVRNVKGIKEITNHDVTPMAPDLVADVFTSFYKPEPQIDETKETLAKDMMRQLYEMKEYQDFHGTSQMDELGSAIGTKQMAPQLIEQYAEIEKKIQEKREEQAKKKEKQKSQKGGPPGGDLPGEQPGEGDGDGEGEPQDGTGQGPPRLDELSDAEKAELRQEMRQAIEQAQEELSEHQSLMRSWGVETADMKQMNPERQMEIAEEMRQAGVLKNISEIIGRLRNVLQAAAALVPSHGHDEIVDIGMGRDLSRILPQELLKLHMTPELFYKDYLEGNLQVYNLKGVENLGKGPIIVAFDISGSMQGSREAWAKAVTIGLMTYASKQRRSFGWLCFDTEVKDRGFFPSSTPATLEDKLHVAKIGTAGGTDFQTPLEAAMKIRDQEPEMKSADIVFVTDGACNLPPKFLQKFNEWKKETGTRVFGVGITDGSHREKAEMSTVEVFSDQICQVNNLGEISHLQAIAQNIVRRNS